jgi:hypothetical protein
MSMLAASAPHYWIHHYDGEESCGCGKVIWSPGACAMSRYTQTQRFLLHLSGHHLELFVGRIACACGYQPFVSTEFTWPEEYAQHIAEVFRTLPIQELPPC